MRDRKFGVEIECGHRTGNTARVRELLVREVAEGNIDRRWVRSGSVGSDGTLVEIRSPILAGKAGFSELRKVMKLLTDTGGYVTSYDGMHVHHDAPEFVGNLELTRELVRSWVANRKNIEKFVARDRWDNGACSAWSGESLNLLESAKKFGTHREILTTPDGYTYEKYFAYGRRDLNISALEEHGTVELRLHEGCLDFERAEAWIRFGQAFLNKVANGKKAVPECENYDELLRRLRVAQVARERLSVRAADRYGEVRV